MSTIRLAVPASHLTTAMDARKIAWRFILLATGAGFAAGTVQGQTVVQPQSWTACVACHSNVATSVGPSLQGVVGRKSGSVQGFTYSKAMTGAGIIWNEETLTSFLSDPQKAVPGTRMYFPGVSDPAELERLITFMKTLR